MWFRRVECHFVPSWGSFIQFEYFNKFMKTVKITVIVLFNHVVNFGPKFALNYLHFAFFAYLNLVHILLHHKICLTPCDHRMPPNATECHRMPPNATVCHRMPPYATVCHRMPPKSLCVPFWPCIFLKPYF